jgi:hypothetical protein
MASAPKPVTTKQTPNGGGSSMRVNYATGSGSRPTGSKTRTESTAPASKQKLRG